MLRERAIQVGLSRSLSEDYVASIVAIEDATALAREVGAAHAAKDVRAAMAPLLPRLPLERPDLPLCDEATLVRLGMALSGEG